MSRKQKKARALDVSRNRYNENEMSTFCRLNAEDIISGTHSSVKQTVEINRVKTNDEITLPPKPKKQEFGINYQISKKDSQYSEIINPNLFKCFGDITVICLKTED